MMQKLTRRDIISYQRDAIKFYPILFPNTTSSFLSSQQIHFYINCTNSQKNIQQNKYISRTLLHPPKPSKLLILDRVVLIKFSFQKQFDSLSSNKCMKSIHLEMKILAVFQIYIAILGFFYSLYKLLYTWSSHYLLSPG